MGVLYVNYEYFCLNNTRIYMDINLDTVLTALSIFSKTDAKYFHSCLGIDDKKAEMLLTWAEDVVNGYLDLDAEWDVPDVIRDLLVSAKFHSLNSPQALYMILHGYFCLASVLERDNDYFCLSEHITAEDIQQNINNNTN